METGPVRHVAPVYVDDAEICNRTGLKRGDGREKDGRLFPVGQTDKAHPESSVKSTGKDGETVSRLSLEPVRGSRFKSDG